MQRLKDQVAIVTGGAQGIGGATARRFGEEGARVLIADVDEAAAIANRDRIREAGGTAETIVADVSQPGQIRAMVERAVALWGGLNLLVNNAYGGGPGQQGSAV